MSNGGLSTIFNLINLAVDSRTKFKAIQGDEEKAAKCVRYGVFASVWAVVNPLVLLLCIAALKAMFGADDTTLLVAFLLIIVAALFLGIIALMIVFFFTPAMFVQASRQLRLPKKAGGIVGLSLSFISLAAEAFIVYSVLFAA